MRVMYFGTAEFAVPALRALAARPGLAPVCVVTQPDRPRGRHLRLQPCPVKAAALELGLPVLSPERVADPAALAELAAFRPDAIAVAAYGQYLPGAVLRMPPLACVNIHPSLLPTYRGASPIQTAVANGDEETGVTILHVSPKMDAGDLILQERCAIPPEATAATMEPLLAERGARLLVEALELLAAGQAPRRPQDERLVVETRKFEKQDGRVDWTLPATVLHHRVRGYQPWPGVFCALPGEPPRQLKLLRTRVEAARGEPGRVLEVTPEGPLIAAGEGALRLLEVQPEGKRAMPARDWLHGASVAAGDRWPG